MLMNGKKGLIMGVANEKSIAWGIAKAISEEGGELAFTYQGDAIKKRVFPLAESINSNLVEDGIKFLPNPSILYGKISPGSRIPVS